MQSRMSIDSYREPQRDMQASPMRGRASSVRQSWTNDASLVNVANAAIEHQPSAHGYQRHMKSKSMSQTQLQNRYLEQEEDTYERPMTHYQ